MNFHQSAYVMLQLGSDPSNTRKWLKCLRETAEFYGWLDACQPWLSSGARQDSNGRTWVTHPGKTRHSTGGLPIVVCRSADRGGWPRGKTNRFRVGNQVANRDLAWLVANSSVPIGWMTDTSECRVSGERWIERAASAGFGVAGFPPRTRN